MKKTIKVKVGDTVLFKNERGLAWNREGFMDKYIGQKAIVGLILDSEGTAFAIDGAGWRFSTKDINNRPRKKLYLK